MKNQHKDILIKIITLWKENIMEYAKLGNTDIEVSRLCVGCMSFGKASEDFISGHLILRIQKQW